MVEVQFDKSKKDLKITKRAMIYLVSCGIHGTAPDPAKLNQVDWEELYRMAKLHSLTAICYMALEQASLLNLCSDQELLIRWKDSKEKAVRKNLILDAERKVICAYMEQAGIWYMPLKGIILKEMYPKLGMRQMADNDILYDVSYQMQLKNFMVKRGYTAKLVGIGNHDVYLKPPVYNFELHTALYGKEHKEGWDTYYLDVKDRLILDEDRGYGYHFSDDDFYVYIVSHAYKHFDGSGTGLRSLLDLYVFLQKKQSVLNWDYIRGELKELGIAEFEQQSRTLGEKIFGVAEQALTGEEVEQLQYVLASGTYGTMKHGVQKKLRTLQQDHTAIQKKTKWKYLWQRMFPEKEWFMRYKPICNRHPWMIPFYRIFRLVHGIICRRKKIKSEIQTVRICSSDR